MKHMKVISKDIPKSASIFNWFGRRGSLKAVGKPAYVEGLWLSADSIDPSDLINLLWP